ncbi:ROK family protein [Anaeromicropila herbilytica]|uniref:fructokinase n=1 Tax=Anaeromicropila herbilytica TaxID=2785025 RepID=A0A7R7EM19_9FIRM|nr:ROK family protein [Anaeromicropila herbilytica]BCN31272.1 putative fructokinase [Anaeromicropila herbilytica]
MILGALEAGGTKMVCAVGDNQGNITDKVVIPTKTPEETMNSIIDYFQTKKIEGLGVGSFGPIDLNPKSETYGHILKSPKLAWNQYDIVGVLERALHIPVAIDTDVNSSVLGEVTYGCAKDLDPVVYITVGTGIGIGIYVNGHLLNGMLHPEGGHILITRHKDDVYHGKCPFHDNCFEGLASGPAIEERWNQKAEELAQKEEVWQLEAYYIAQAIVQYILILSPRKIILGGGVMHVSKLLPMIRSKVIKLLGGYLDTKELARIDKYIIPESLAGDQGILGCLELIRRKLSE